MTDVPPRYQRILDLLRAKGPMSARDVASELGLTYGTVQQYAWQMRNLELLYATDGGRSSKLEAV